MAEQITRIGDDPIDCVETDGDGIRHERLKAMSLEGALSEIGNRVYMAACFVEDLEHAGKVYGNGHHVAQDIAAYAQARVLERWEDDEEVKTVDDRHPAALALAMRIRQEYSQ